MTSAAHSGSIRTPMLYVIAIMMFVAGCIVAVGYAGRVPREERDSRHGKRP